MKNSFAISKQLSCKCDFYGFSRVRKINTLSIFGYKKYFWEGLKVV